MKRLDENTEERTFKKSVKRTPWYIWLIFIVFSLFGLFFLIIPPLSLFGIVIIAFFWFACFWLPYYTWKNEHIRATWPSGNLTADIIFNDTNMLPNDYRIVEDIAVKTDVSLGGEYGDVTITFEKSGQYKIEPSMFQKYYSAIEIAWHIEAGEGVYLVFTNKTSKLKRVYRKKYWTLENI